MNSRPAREALGLRFDHVSLAAQVALALTFAALWLLGRRYAGLVHDAILYVGIGLRRLEAAPLNADLFFSGGAQDAYTVFPALYAPLVGALGPGAAALAVTVAGQLAFVGAAAALVWRLGQGPVRWWSMALLAVVSGYYGGVGVFRIAEPFATARTLAEPLVVLALACTLGARHAAAAATLAAAALLHPLVALPGIAMAILWHALASQAWRRLIFPSLLLAGSMLAATSLWPGLRFDAAWLETVRQRSPHLFLSEWLAPDWARLAWGFCVAWIAAQMVDTGVRRMLVAAAVAVLGALAVSGVAVDLVDSAFVAGLQLWRAHWLLHLLATLLVPVAVAGLWRRGPAARAAAACLAASVCFGRFELSAATVLSLLAAGFAGLERRRPGAVGESTLRAVVLLASCAAAVGLLLEVQGRLPLEYSAHASAGWGEYVHTAASLGALLPLGVLLLLLAYSRRTGVALALALAALAFSLAVWDARSPWRRFLEEAHAMANPFTPALTRSAEVLWPAPGIPAWLVLGKPSWFSVDQGAGIVFSRATALEYAARERATRRLRASIASCATAGDGTCQVDAVAARQACAATNGPQSLVVNAPIDGFAGTPWQVPSESGTGTQRLLLYRCGDLLAGSPAAATK